MNNAHFVCKNIFQVNFPEHAAIPTFDNLTYLKINSLNYRWHFLVEVLKHCLKLEKLILNEAGGHGATSETWSRKDDKEQWVDPKVVPECLSSHLKSCDLYTFLGLEGELHLACYILKNARVLEEMMIWNVGHTEVKRSIFSCLKASAKCRVILKHVCYSILNLC
ncbi:putative FBD domain-containing protein [Medicago truncatula]|uniref:Putative FBD domain-containing protein n=1 Tax=Medicago truncatula TaxID=3880 RepID=A0A396GXV3_MEDTR|nr:putative FBD domain-containing protein [Medicago truncatula]